MTAPDILNRAELVALVERCLDAFVARDAALLPLSAQARYTENGQLLPIGDGFWATCNRAGSYRHIVADPVTQQAGVMAVLYENEIAVIFGARLSVEQGKITEIEVMVSRDPLFFNPDGPQRLEAMGEPLPIWQQRVRPENRPDRAQLAALANAYFSVVERNDGTKTAPFAPGVERWDNGRRATHAPDLDPPGAQPFYALGAGEQLALGYFRFVSRVRDRRYPIIDEEAGTVFALAFLDHAGTMHEVELTDGRIMPVAIKQPFSWQIMDMLKITDGQIQQMEVLLNKCFYGMRSGW
ncbi:MAG: hypothetical protein E2598_09520 [Sphingobium sp.]|nr:hypothetical protein [Sphingobium sp.]